MKLVTLFINLSNNVEAVRLRQSFGDYPYYVALTQKNSRDATLGVHSLNLQTIYIQGALGVHCIKKFVYLLHNTAYLPLGSNLPTFQ